ncbi:hypothetical protein [Clostridium tertium]
MKLKEELKKEIRNLRMTGLSYRQVAAETGLSKDCVRNYCKSVGLDGLGSELSSALRCKFCNKAIERKATGRIPIYCSVDCKKKWYQVNPIMYEHVCDYCGKEFTSLAKIVKFCSHKCFERNRFYRKEDIQMVIKFLEKEEAIPNAPVWIKKLVNGISDREGH